MDTKSIVYIPEIQAKQDLEMFLELLPDTILSAINESGRADELLELVMDLGRRPSARFIDGELILRETPVLADEIDYIVENISDFDDDNRAGIARTLHRISGIRNRKGTVIGLTCRIGRAVFGTIDIIEDIVKEGNSVLILGAPGVGKTTMLREVARILSEEKRVVIVDTSNEIGGDGDIPHRAVGRARRLQVPKPSHQHETMIEAVENHNPEVIIIDEIGREQEALAARTINERGVQLIGTAHGRTLENLLLNPTLSDLVGGIESVTLSDDEARRRGTQKTVLERRSPPTFNVLIEIQERQRLLVHREVAYSVDAMLRGRGFPIEVRARDEDGNIIVEQDAAVPSTDSSVTGRRQDIPDPTTFVNGNGNGREKDGNKKRKKQQQAILSQYLAEEQEPAEELPQSVRIYTYGVARNRLYNVAERLGVSVSIVDTLDEADMFVTLKAYYRKHRRLAAQAEQKQISVHVLRANTDTQIENFLKNALNLPSINSDPLDAAIANAHEGIEKIQTGVANVDLAPVGTALRRYQHQMARQANFVSHSYGKEPNRHVRIFNMPRNASVPGMEM